MQSRLWEGGESSNGFVSSRQSWHQGGRWENGKKKETEHQNSSLGDRAVPAARGTGAGAAGAQGRATAAGINNSSSVSAVGRTIRASNMAANPPLSPQENPFAHPTTSSINSSDNLSRARRSRTPRSDSAVKDGKKFLAAFRAQKQSSPASVSVDLATATHPSSSTRTHPATTEESLDAPPGLADALAQRVDRYESCAPGLARNLEAALEASSVGGGCHPGEGGSGSKSDREQDNGGGGGRDGGDVVVGESSSPVVVVAVGPQQDEPTHDISNNDGDHDDDNNSNNDDDDDDDDDDDNNVDGNKNVDGNNDNDSRRSSSNSRSSPLAGSAGGGTGGGGGGGSTETGSSVLPRDGVIAAAAAAAPAAEPKPSPKTDSERSPERPSPEMLRQAAQTSQAFFLSTVLPTEDFSSGGSPPITPKPRHWSSATGPAPAGGHAGESRRARPGAGGVTATSAVADKEAVTRWASLRRLQDQAVGLGNATDHQLGRALDLCRNLRGLQTGVRGDGGPISGHERMSWLDALQSSLYGLQEILAKRSLVAEAAKREAEAIGGPAVVSRVLNGGGGDGGGGGEGEGAQTGWLSGAQLKAFEGEIQARSSMEIAALESERRKLRSKVEMFQRQVQFLQRNGALPSPGATNGSSSGRIGASPSAYPGGGDGPDSTAGKRFTDLLDARLGEERHVQATLEAEVTSLRGSLEEKDGLIDALREALRSSASGEETGDPGDAIATAVAVEREAAAAEAAARNVAEVAPAPASAPAPTPDVFPGRLVVGRGVFARSGGRNRERYRSRTSRLLSASGPVAMAEAETAATAAKAEAAAAAAAAAVTARREAVLLLPRRTEGENTLALGGEPEGGVAGSVRVHPRPAGAAAAALSLSSSSSLHDGSAAENAGAGLEAALPVAGTLAAGAAASDNVQDGRPAVSGTAVSGQGALPVGGVRENGDDGSGVMYQASAVTGAAFRVLRDSARVVRSRVGLDGAAPSPGKPGRRSASSHAVLIL